jgi:hypothetical protein
MKHDEICSAAQLTAFIHEVGFLPLLDSGIRGRDVSRCSRTPQESYQRILDHFRVVLPEATDQQILRLV